MVFAIPDIKDVVRRARNSFRAEMPGTDAFLWPNNIYVSAKVMGGAVWELFGRLKWMDRQRFALTATGYELERHGLDYGIARKPASYAQGDIVVVSDIPGTIPSGTKFYRNDGLSFTSTQAKTTDIFALTATIPVVCDTAGRTGNTTYGTPMTVTVAGLTITAAVDDVGLGQGADVETDDQLRVRILHRKRYPPHGGAESDYIGWGLELPGVTRVFARGNVWGRGTVGVWFLMDDTYTAGIPLQADVDAMQAHIDAVKPITANVFVRAPIADCIDIVVKGLTPDTQAVRESVGSELQTLFRRMARPGLPNDAFTLQPSWIWQAVSNATGENYHEIVQPTSALTFSPGVMPCLRSVSFIP